VERTHSLVCVVRGLEVPSRWTGVTPESGEYCSC
jgi:hypothetical protein